MHHFVRLVAPKLCPNNKFAILVAPPVKKFLRKIARGGANRSFGIEVASLAGVPKEITVRAKSILKALEKNDITKGGGILENIDDQPEVRELCEVEKILADTDIDTLSPMQALLLLSDLKEKVKLEK